MIRAFGAVAFGVAMIVIPGFAQTQPGNVPPAQPAGGILGRPSPPQPTQRQGVEYFAGTWSFKWNGRSSALSAGPLEGTATFTRRGETPVLDVRVEARVDDGGRYLETGTMEWNDAQKMMTMRLQVDGANVAGNGDWTSPIALRFESAPVKVGTETVRLRRVYNIISATSFTVAEELSSNGGPYTRLGRGVYSRPAKP
jgi:hypothetical protein